MASRWASLPAPTHIGLTVMQMGPDALRAFHLPTIWLSILLQHPPPQGDMVEELGTKSPRINR